MKRVLQIVCIATFSLIGLSFSGCGPTDPADQKFVLTFGHLANEQNSWHLGALKFAELCDEKSGGRLTVKVFPNETLGKELELINGIQNGTFDMTITGETLQNWVDKAVFCAVPYLIRDDEHLEKVVGGEIGKSIEADLIEAGIRPIAYFARSARNLTSNRPIKQPSDLQGIILRLPNDPMSIAVWQALGAKPTPMAFSEVFTSLQQGTVEAQENPFALIESANFSEVQDYCNLTEHTISWAYVLLGEAKYQSLPADLQQVVMEAAQEMQQYEHELFVADRDRLATELQAQGMEFVEVDKEAFKALAKDAVMEQLKPELRPTYEQILAIE